jgi:Immunity protein 40
LAKSVRDLLSADAIACAIDLSEVGSNGWAWLRDDALSVIAEAERAHVVILGGDVWSMAGSQIERTYANWYARDVGIKPADDDVTRCAAQARDYVSSYSSVRLESSSAVFELVLGETSLGH